MSIEERGQQYVRMTSGGDEVEEGVYPVVPETGVTFDTGLFSENIIILAFKVANDLLEAIVEEGQGMWLNERTNVRTQTRCQCCHRIRGYRQW